MSLIGLIAAMPEECRPLLRCVRHCETRQLGPFSSFRFHLGGNDCQLVQSGIGMKRAQNAARALLAVADPQILVSFGIAGAVKAGLAIGDVVTLNHVSRLEHGIPGPLVPLAPFSPRAQAAVEIAVRLRGARLVSGVSLTTLGSQLVDTQSLSMENPVLEMETFAIGQAAAEYGIPLVALRGVSDNPAEPLPIDPGAVMNNNDQLRVGKLIQILLCNPKILFQLNRLRRNTALAAENTAVAVLAALSS